MKTRYRYGDSMTLEKGDIIDLLVLFDCILDIHIPVKKFPLGVSHIESIPSMSMSPGGACNVAIAAAKTGCKAAMYDTVGDDAYGSALIDTLKSYGVRTESMHIKKNYTTGICAILYDGRDGHAMLGKYTPPPAQAVAKTKSVGKARNVFFNGYSLTGGASSSKAVREMLNRAKKDGSRIYFDTGPFVSDIAGISNFVELSDTIFFNAAESMKYTHMKSLQHAANSLLKMKQTAVIKNGSAGAVLIHEGRAVNIPPYKSSSGRFTFGAGDVFDGTYISLRSQGYDEYRSAQMSCIAAGLKTAGAGPDFIPSLSEIKTKLEAQVKAA